ncbi:uncharacterized protein N7459_002195 [Penicillium hispanicum]|uniref:uncharacterized protein n=1 Tax=Penicillium hispanicum TaxID=1080232 RepID=UPI00254150A0|nr:uncharacterized protein N7459_002195 [Penicillium hispanicum]KAJ5591826.1 hypothetical protein N7459_002195 [Penicillium hispanicum]
MALAIQAASFLHQFFWPRLHPTPSKRPDAIKIGVIAEGHLDPATIIDPSTSHPCTVLHAISASDSLIAESLSSKYHFTKAYGSHARLLQDPAVDAVYVSAPIGCRYALVRQALAEGKHVLCDAPMAANSEEVRVLVDYAKHQGVVLLDGVHWQFHPATHAWRKMVDSNEYGRILRAEATMTCTPGIHSTDNRWKYEAAGGSAISLLPALNAARFALHASTPSALVSVTARLSPTDPRIDAALHARLVFEDPRGNAVNCRVHTDLARPWAGGLVPRLWEVPAVEVETEKAVLCFYNFAMPHLYHWIRVREKGGSGMGTVYRKQYEGGPLWGRVAVSTGEKGGRTGWSSYRWQLEAFVDAVQGRTPAFWVAGQESVWMMECVDAVYRAAGLPVRESVGKE